MSSDRFFMSAVQGGRARRQPGDGNIGHFGWVERCRRDEANRLDTPG
ncbi:MAG: hypothetical protein QOD02_6082 [Mycobacterium sp.]|jgi:hypothetical protein|nr:hypothetical protein [Mycobacterium sp.]